MGMKKVQFRPRGAPGDHGSSAGCRDQKMQRCGDPKNAEMRRPADAKRSTNVRLERDKMNGDRDPIPATGQEARGCLATIRAKKGGMICSAYDSF